MHTRKIAYVTGLGLLAMPAHYDPALVTRDDAEHDSAICGAAEELAVLRAASKRTSDMARDTAPTASEDALSELDAIDEQWQDALRATRLGDIRGVRESLDLAKRYADRWGSSQQEDAALAMVTA